MPMPFDEFPPQSVSPPFPTKAESLEQIARLASAWGKQKIQDTRLVYIAICTALFRRLATGIVIIKEKAE